MRNNESQFAVIKKSHTKSGVNNTAVHYSAPWSVPQRMTDASIRMLSVFAFVFLSWASFAQPTNQAKDITVVPIGATPGSVRVSWTNGNGANRIVIITTFTGTYSPTDGVAAPASNENFGLGTDLDPAGGPAIAKSVFNSETDGGGTSVDVAGLSDDTRYFVRIYEYNGTVATTLFNMLADSRNPIGLQNNITDGTFTRPTGVTKVTVAAWGGGGGGGGADSNGTENRAGGGGGGGTYTFDSNVTIAGNIAIDVGAKGIGGDGGDSPENGGAGFPTTFGATLVTSAGGAGGVLADGTDRTGAGASATAGTTANGGAGGEAPPAATTTSQATASGAGGASGGPGGNGGNATTSTAGIAAAGGGNGAPGLTGLAANTGSVGIDATQVGGGGSGGWDNRDDMGGAGAKGGDGFRGQLIVTWTTPPTPAITVLGPSPTNGNPVFRVVFSTPINTGSFIGTDVTITGTTAGTESATIAEIAPNNGTTFTITVSGMTGSGTVIAAMAAGVVTDVSGNVSFISNAGTTINYVHDVTGPTVAISVSGPNPTNTPPVFQVLFNEPITLSSFVSGDVVLTGTAGATTPTITEIAPNDGTTFTITATGMTGPGTVIANIAAGVIQDRAAVPNTNTVANLNTTINFDNQAPTAPGTPTAAAGPIINDAEEAAGFNVVVPLGTSGAVANDEVELLLGGAPFAPPIIVTLTGTDITNTFATLNIPTTRLGADNPKSISARVIDEVGNTGPAGAALVLELDTTFPTAPGNPTAAAGPFINLAENGTFSIVVPGISGTGAEVNDVVTLFIGGVSFLTHTLTAPEAAAPSYTFINVTLPVPDGAKSITARVTDEGGNEGPANVTPLVLTRDVAPPTAPNPPTAAAGPVIDGSEYTAGFIVNVSGLVATGAVANDVLELLIGGVPFPTPLTNVLDGGEITGGNINFTVICPQLGADAVGKLISARVVDEAGNVGAPSTNLSLDLSTEPTAASTALTFTPFTTTSATVSFTNGNGTSRIIVARQGAAVSFVPSDNTTYTANNDFAAAADLGSGNKVVGTATGDVITNLPSGDVIHFAIFEFNNCATRENYFTTALTGSQAIASANASTIGTGSGAATISSLIDTQAEAAAASANFSFIVDDDGATNGADAAPTRITSLVIKRDLVNDQTVNWTNVIGGVILTDGVASINSVANPANFSVTADEITIAGISSALSTDLGYVGDNTTKTLQVKIWLQTNISALDIDNKRLVFTANITDFAVAVTNSSGFAASTATSGAGNGQVTVIADRLAFSTIPAGGTAGTGFPLAIAATDVNGNVDLNQTQQVTITAPTFPATGQIIFTYATPSNAAQNMTAGRASWTNAKATAGGNYTFRVSDTDPALPLLTQFTSGTITFANPSATSSVIASGAFVAPPTIDYTLYQHPASFTLASPPPAGSIEVGRFIIQDGPGGVDADQIGTTLTALTLNVTTPGNLRFVGISDGTNIVASAAGGGTINLTGMSLLAEDVANTGTGLMTFSVFASFDANVVDNQNFQMTITSVTTGNGGSTFALPDGGGAGTSPAANVVVVSADRYNIIQNPPASLLIGTVMTPAITVEATDPLGSRDLDIDASIVGLLSNGSMITTPTASMVDGLGTFSNIIHNQTATVRTLTTTNSDGFLNDASTTFNLTASGISDIVANGVFIYPQNVNYAGFQESVNLTTINSQVVAQYDIRDGGLAGDLDGAPTTLTGITFSVVNAGFIRRAALYDGLLELSETTPSGGNLIFTGFSVAAADNTSKTLSLHVSYTAAVTDNQQFSFLVTSTSTQPLASSTFIAPNAGGAISSTALDNNRIEVSATQLTFTANLGSPLLPQKDISLQQAVPVVTAVDGLGNRDRDYSSNITISSAISLFPSITLVADVAVPNSGVYTFPSNFQYVTTGNGTLTLNAPGLAGVVSNAVTVQAGTATTITAGAAAPATISSLVNTIGAAVSAFNFVVNDDPIGTPGPNNDGLPTLISQMVITANIANNTIPDWSQAIAGAILTDGTNNINAIAISSNSITFGGINTAAGQLGHIADNASKTYTLRIYLRASLLGALPTTIDGLKFEFQILQSNMTLATNSTGIIGGESSTSGNADVVTVVASTLRFLSPAGPTTVSLDTDFPGIQIEAVDANNNRDLGFTGAAGTVRQFTNTASAAMSNGPVVNTTQFTSGLLSFASNFRFTSGNSGDDVTLNIRAGAGGTNCGVNAICATSPTLTLLSSFESSIIGDPTYTYSTDLPYVAHQEPSNIQNTATSLEIGRMLLVDGSRVGFPYGAFLITTGTENDGFANSDQDGAATNLTSITIRITNPSNLRRLALYSAGAEIGTEINVAGIGAITDATPFYDFVFTGSPLVAAPDNTIVPISIRASFRNTAPQVTDGDAIDFSIVAATVTSGSNFFTAIPPPTYIAGVPNGFSSPLGFNLVNIVATKLDFISQPAVFAGINTLVTTGVAEAHDQFSLLDTDFDAVPALLSAAVSVNGTFAFASGVLDMSSMTYGGAGNGTLTVTAGGLSSNTNNVVGGLPNVSTQCVNVEVLHVTTNYTNGGAGGVITSPNLIGGTANKVIFGFTFNAPYTVSTPNHPLVTRFTITFSQPTAGVFFNMRLQESTSPVYNAGLPDVTTLGAVVSQPSSTTLQIDFSGSPRDLVANPQLSYFLTVDVDINASGNMGGSTMVVAVVDDNILGSPTNSNILVSNGSSGSSTVSPNAYTFASVFPPTLNSSYPSLAQLNVDPTQSTLRLLFSVPVYSLDGRVQLVDKVTGIPTLLTAANGTFPGTPVSPIIFNIPPGTMVADREYYVLIAQGNRAGLTGIMDESDNLFPGISYSGTLYFRTANTVPPQLLGSGTIPSVVNDPVFTDVSPENATLNVTMDKKGRAFYLVLSANTAPPTVAEIKGLSAYGPGGVLARGAFNVTTNNPISQFGTVTPLVGNFPAGPKYVWICSESYSEKDGVPTAIPTPAPYGAAPLFAVGGAGPTLVFSVPGGPFPGVVTLNTPNISICNDSYQVLNSPIIITEGTNTQFNTGGGQVTMNIVLPAGFEFDNSTTSGVPNYGTLTLLGSDFLPGSGQVSYLSNTIITIRYRNLYQNVVLGGTKDKILLSNLRVRASSTSTGSMFRLGGTALTSIVDGTPLAQLSSFAAPAITFDNSYSAGLGVVHPGNVITSIPDNASPAFVQLTPYIPPTANDFGPSSFSGLGVNINILSLTAVTPDVPFNIRINHIDNNGCKSENPVQYLVYDHTSAVNISFAGNPDQGPYCTVNTNFAIGNVVAPTYNQVVRSVPYDNLASYYMETLTAAIPVGTTSLALDPVNGRVINPIDGGGAWVGIINNLPVEVSSIPIGGRTYRSYTFDEANILDAAALSGGALPNPYEVFRKTTSFQNNTYYTGGSLGLVEFTGTYRSISNQTVQVPRKQVVEFYLPAIPIVEVGLSNQTAPGIYCEAGGKIQISGYPEAVIGQSVGRFTVTDVLSGTVIYDVPPVGAPTIPGIIAPNLPGSAFVDFGNGTAELDPSQLWNNYRQLRITYTYQLNGSPCESSGSIDIQVAPNPITDFTFTSPIGPNTPVGTAYCEDRVVDFNASATTIAPGFSVVSYAWIFGEISSGSNTATGIMAPHTYDLPATYSVELRAVSNTGCLSVPSPYIAGGLVVGAKIKPITVGGIPEVKFKMDGVSYNDTFRFNSNDTNTDIPVPTAAPAGNNPANDTRIPGGNGSPNNDFISRYVWDFGDATSATVNRAVGPAIPSTDAEFNANVVTHKYLTPGVRMVNLTVTSNIGCQNSLLLQNSYRSMVVLDSIYLAPNSAYDEEFETTNGQWQPWGTGTTIADIRANTTLASWEWGNVYAEVAEPDEPLISKMKIWKTNIPTAPDPGYYNAGEQSALYSPSFNLTNLTRPMISFNSVVQLESSDGVVLQYSLDNRNIADPNKEWLTLGVIGGGQDWYTAQGIAGRPGQQPSSQAIGDIGWSDFNITAWQSPKHVLDTLFPPKSSVPPNKAVFRFALGSASPSVDVQGFALDNVRVGDRTRTILLESFASASNSAAAESNENDFVKTFVGGVGTEVVKLNYHLNFPGKDPFNEDNPADPSSRALFYNIVATPRSVLDGEKDVQDRVISQWGQQLYNLRTLQLAQAAISITPVVNADGTVSITADITSQVLTGIQPNTLVHVVVMEKEVALGGLPTTKQAMVQSGENTFEYIVKKMLPSASGTPIGTVLADGVMRSFGPFTYRPEASKLYPDPDDLAIAVFLQESTPPYEVYQVELVEGITDPPVVTGLEPIAAEQILVYPNPANREMTVQMPGQLAKEAGLQLIDQTGRVSMRSLIAEGADRKTLNVSDLSSGVYILTVDMGNGFLTRKKVIIVHQD